MRTAAVTLLALTVALGCEARTQEQSVGPKGSAEANGQPGPSGKGVATSGVSNAPQRSEAAGEPPDLLLSRGVESLKLQTAVHDRLFQIGEASWALDQGTGVITFTSPEGIVATAEAQIIGSFNTKDSTWLWAWDNPSIQPPLRAHALLAKAYGEKHELSDLTRPKFETTEARAWELTAMACRLAECQGAYRGPADPARFFITYGEVALQKR